MDWLQQIQAGIVSSGRYAPIDIERITMDITAIADQVMEHLGNSPEAIKDILSDPAGAIEGITGNKLEGADLSGVIDHVKDAVMGGGIELPEGLDLGAITENLGGLTENLGDVLENSPLSGIAEGLGGLFGKK